VSVARRLHVPRLQTGDCPLDARQAHHARDVLRLPDGATVEAFDDDGNVAEGTLRYDGPGGASVRVSSIQASASKHAVWTIASAVPKGDRADWMIEKLSELGTARFIPLAAARSVVLPEGKNKRERWQRIATESAKQSRRSGVMRIDELMRVPDLLRAFTQTSGASGWYFSTEAPAQPIQAAMVNLDARRYPLLMLVGPEGGWSAEELAAFGAAQLQAVRLTSTILRIETAAIAAAAIVGSTWITPTHAAAEGSGPRSSASDKVDDAGY
jgi:16S rRNA (uracil1498-N3)-methyltransferase